MCRSRLPSGGIIHRHLAAMTRAADRDQGVHIGHPGGIDRALQPRERAIWVQAFRLPLDLEDA